MVTEEYGVLYEAHANEVYRFLLYFMGNREDAEDVTQETFLRVMHKWQQFGYRADVRTWIISIAKNTAIDLLRKRKRRHVLDRMFRQQPDVPSELPEEFLHLSENRRMLYAAIQALALDYRAVAVLRGIQEMTPAETATILGWSQNKVNWVYHRAIKALRKQLTDKGDEWEWIGQLTNSK